MGTDRDWEKWGADDPYFGVLSSESFRRERLDEDARRAFFASGQEHVERIRALLAEHFGCAQAPDSVLDFGCGVGRLLIPFAQRASRCVGVDVSESMLAEARRNLQSAGISHARLVHSDGRLDALDERFDLVHTYIVLQHIPWPRGRLILQQLARHVAPGGFLAAHVFSASTAPAWVRFAVRLRYLFPPLRWVRNLAKGRPMFEPSMQLHVYDAQRVAEDLASLGFGTTVPVREPDVDGFESMILLSRRGAVG